MTAPASCAFQLSCITNFPRILGVPEFPVREDVEMFSNGSTLDKESQRPWDLLGIWINVGQKMGMAHAELQLSRSLSGWLSQIESLEQSRYLRETE
jgi:hypothetical protein